MSKVSLNGSSIARLAAILTILLFAPLTALATDASFHTLVQSKLVATGATGEYEAVNVVDATPAETPRHCHLKSSQPQANGWSQAPIGSDQPLPALSLLHASARETGLHLPVVSALAPVVTLSRFILFSNFRS